MADKIFIKGIYGKVINTQYGEIGKVSIHLEKFVESAKAYVNDKGYVNIDILKSSKKDELGNDIWYTALDTYKKDDTKNGSRKPNEAKDDRAFTDLVSFFRNQVDNTPTSKIGAPPVDDDIPF